MGKGLEDLANRIRDFYFFNLEEYVRDCPFKISLFNIMSALRSKFLYVKFQSLKSIIRPKMT